MNIEKYKNVLKEWAMLGGYLMIILFVLGLVVVGFAEPFLKTWAFLKYLFS